MLKFIIGFVAAFAASMGAIPSATDIVEKWTRRAGQATPDFVKGVQRVTTAPGEMAAAKVDKYLAGLQANVDKWVRRVSGVSLQEWKRLTTEKGQARYGPGVTAAAAKTQQFWQEFIPFLQATQDAANAMPDLTLEDRINKAVFVMRRTAEFSRS